jgi:hypothetical protein
VPRYYFNTRIQGDLIEDPDGEDFRDADKAWDFANALARGLLSEYPEELTLITGVIEVRGEDGEIVLEFPLAEALVDPGDVQGAPTKH